MTWLSLTQSICCSAQELGYQSRKEHYPNVAKQRKCELGTIRLYGHKSKTGDRKNCFEKNKCFCFDRNKCKSIFAGYWCIC